jgi:hypothetical protein
VEMELKQLSRQIEAKLSRTEIMSVYVMGVAFHANQSIDSHMSPPPPSHTLTHQRNPSPIPAHPLTGTSRSCRTRSSRQWRRRCWA